MARSPSYVKWSALALVGLFSLACDFRSFLVQLPSFEENQVLGMGVWKADANGQFERSAQIVFGSVRQEGGEEHLSYSVEADGESISLDAVLERAAVSPEDVNVRLWYGGGPGTYKLTTYNAAGESSLSKGTLTW